MEVGYKDSEHVFKAERITIESMDFQMEMKREEVRFLLIGVRFCGVGFTYLFDVVIVSCSNRVIEDFDLPQIKLVGRSS